MKYNSTITGWGTEAKSFLQELNYLIFFNDDAPAELAEISILHSKADLQDDIKVGDTFIIGEKAFNVTAVGDEAQHTFKQLGHATFNFSGGDTAAMPGHIMLEGDEELTVDDIQKGIEMSFY